MGYVVNVKNVSKAYQVGALNKKSFKEEINNKILSLMGSKQESTHQETLWALKDVSFSLEKGSCLGVIGNNGSGKSTLLKIISGLTSPTTGSVETVGRISSLLEVGTGFHPDLTGRENVYLNGAILGMSKEEISAKFQQIVEFSEIEKFIDTPVKHYSSGMRVRLAFSIAIHVDSDLLLIDEVLAVGDKRFREKSGQYIKDLIRSKKTSAIIVSHNLPSISDLCNEVIILEKGRMIEKATPNIALSTYMQLEKTAAHPTYENIISEGAVSVNSFYINDDNKDNPKNNISQGSQFNVSLEIENNTNEDLPIYFNIIIKSFSRGTLLYLGNKYQNRDIVIPARGINKYKIKFNPIFLPEGTYSVDLIINDSLHKNAPPLYFWKDAFYLTLKESDMQHSEVWRGFPNDLSEGMLPIEGIDIEELIVKYEN